MIVFGITGGTGAGKSTISDEFRRQGVYVIDADLTARSVCERGSACLKELADCFGEQILDETGALKRRELGDIVFADEDKLNRLNEITHRYIHNEIRSELAAVKADIAAIDGAVIIGSPVQALCVCIVSVLADRDTRITRIMRRDGISGSRARARLDAQPEEDFYIRNSDYVIYNNGSPSEASAQVADILKKIKGV